MWGLGVYRAFGFRGLGACAFLVFWGSQFRVPRRAAGVEVSSFFFGVLKNELSCSGFPLHPLTHHCTFLS